MKKLLFSLLLLCSLTTFTFSQSRYLSGQIASNNLRLGVGQHIIGPENEDMPKLELEYIHFFNEDFLFGTSINLGQTKFSDRQFFVSSSYFELSRLHIDLTAYYDALHTDKWHIYTGGGLSFAFNRQIETVEFDVGFTDVYIDDWKTLGGSLFLQVDYTIFNTTKLGLRLSAIEYINGDVTGGISINLVKAFNKR